ncbi:lipopolysaccharide kinase InaA family protein [Salinisphaera sp.]|uniref:lipopolysaccharide kinase InaA family protein n=1 Tax=Salinisphaera sp. TaxID=1914330 RepID=UPI0025FFF7A7|nr:lipopolysaccharide kinase InaA family protein [Salinisphaera sp.]
MLHWQLTVVGKARINESESVWNMLLAQSPRARGGAWLMRFHLERALVEPGDTWMMSFDEPVPDFSQAQEIYRGEHTRVCLHPDRLALVSKLSIVQAVPRDPFRKYRYCQAAREIAAADVLVRLGLRTPTMRGFGYTLMPWARHESILFMDEFPPSRPLRFVFREDLSEPRRHGLLAGVATGLGRVYAAGYHLKDFHFENILSDRENRLIWIDNDLRHTNRYSLAARRFADALRRLHKTSERFLFTSEWHYLLDGLGRALNTSALGQHLAGKVLPRFRIDTSACHFDVF